MKKLILIFGLFIFANENVVGQEAEQVAYSPERIELIKAAIPFLIELGINPSKRNVANCIRRAQKMSYNTIGTTKRLSALEILRSGVVKEAYVDYKLASK